MEKVKRIFLLAFAAGCIICFWVTPGINTAKNARYTRTWEDTGNNVHPDPAFVFPSLPDKDTGTTLKIYKKETIEEKATFEDIKPSMFSRAIHFDEEIIYEPEIVLEDSATVTDSVQLVILDSASVL